MAALRRARGILLTALGVLAACYFGLAVFAWLAYPKVLFPAPRITVAPTLHDPAMKLVELPLAGGAGHTLGIHAPPPSPGARTVVLFHGNGESIFDDVVLAGEIRRRGLGILVVEYRGYGLLHGGSPSEAMLYEDAEAGLAYLARAGVTREDVALWGWSLGSSVAAEMAARGHGSRLVLVAAFTSIVDMGRLFAPFLPVSLIMSHRLDTLSKAPKITAPTLVIHGDADELIPIAMGEKLAAALPHAELVRVAGGHHADLFRGASGTPSPGELYDRVAAHLAAR